MFLRLREEWGVPLIDQRRRCNSAGRRAFARTERHAGIGHGSSEATGYLDRSGRITGRLNELAFAPSI